VNGAEGVPSQQVEGWLAGAGDNVVLHAWGADALVAGPRWKDDGSHFLRVVVLQWTRVMH